MGYSPNSVSVSSLICHRDVPLALKCLSSLLKHCQEPIQLILHDDGSLQETDLELLGSELCSPKVIGAAESDERMMQALKNYPKAQNFRRTNIFAKKLLDCISFNTSDTFAYCDTDIYFFKPFVNPFILPDDNTHALFLKDLLHPYSFRFKDFVFARDLKIAQHVNAGMICFRRSQYDLDLIEWLLKKQTLYSKPYFTEQTIWALLGQRAACMLWEPSQIVFMTPAVKMTENIVAGHFASPARHLLKQYIEKYDVPYIEHPTTIRTVPSKQCLPIDLAWFIAKTEITQIAKK